jgi:CRISPR/Cas system-associated endoribonuclease Cas2
MTGVLIYDIPKEKDALRVKVHRELKKIDAEQIQSSVWRAKSLDKLIKIALIIKNSGCKAMVLEEKRLI